MAIISAKTNKDYMPFKTALQGTTFPSLPDVNPSTNPCEPAKIEYVKKPDGHYIFANNPEMLRFEDLNMCNLRTENMSGRYEVTLEHSNYSNHSLYMGYRLTNNGDEDMVVTVYNIGYQYEGEWLGARSWSDFYNLKFERPYDYVDAAGKENWYYVGQDFLDYTPRVFESETYCVPAGQYIWVLGGTTADNFNHANVAGTADILVPHGRCMNATVLFEITAGNPITGSLYFYTDAAEIDENQPEQGYIVMRNETDFSKQYKGIDNAIGLIEAHISWTVNDNTPAGKLPVTYTTRYDSTARNKRGPYEMYSNREWVVEGDEWLTSLNPQSSQLSIGTDMSVFSCVDSEGNTVIIDCLYADAGGNPANLGNWMITYQDNFTLYNTGTSPRTFKIYKKGAVSGALIVAVRDRDGNVLSGKLKCHPIIANKPNPSVDKDNYEVQDGTYWPIVEGKPYYEWIDERALMATVTVQPNNAEQITVEYLILGNSNGGIKHWVELDNQ